MTRRPAIARQGWWAVAIVFAFVMSPGCLILRELGLGGDDAEWETARFEGVNQPDLIALVAGEVDAHYGLKRQDAHIGEVESHWLYGGYDRMKHSATRQRVIARVEREESQLELRVRVQREISDSPGRFDQSSDDEGWEYHDDNVTEARVLLRKISILLESYQVDEEID